MGMTGLPPIRLDHLVFVCWLLTFLQQVVPCVAFLEISSGKTMESGAMMGSEHADNMGITFGRIIAT